LAGGNTSGWQEKDWALDESRSMAIHGHAFLPLQSFSDVSAVNDNRLKRPHLWVISRVPGRRDRDCSYVPRAPAQPVESFLVVSSCRSKAQSGEVTSFSKEVRYLGHIMLPVGITTDPEEMRSIRECLTLKNTKLGAFGAYALITDCLFPVPPTLRNR
jgi:hypothetical protein